MKGLLPSPPCGGAFSKVKTSHLGRAPLQTQDVKIRVKQ